MELKINYERLLYLQDSCLVETKVYEIKTINSKKKISKKSIKKDEVQASKLNIPVEPIIINDMLEPIEELEDINELYEPESIIYNPIQPENIVKSSKLVALTFDDGPNINTNEILDALKETNSKATFFVTGSNIENNKDVIRRIQDDGHQIGNHGYSHTPFTDLSLDKINEELVKTHKALINAGVNPTMIIRPPFCKLNESIKENFNSSFILQNIDSQDNIIKNNKIIINNIKGKVSDGSIILLHELPTTPGLLRTLITDLKKDNYEFVTINELCKQNKVKLEPGKVYAKVKQETIN